MAGDLGAVVGDHELAAGDRELDAPADERARHAVARRAVAHRAQAIDRAERGRRERRSERGQGAAASVRSIARRSAGTAAISLWTPAVALGAPGGGGRVRDVEIARPAAGRDEEVGLGIPDEALHDALRLGVGGLAEVGPEAVVGGEGDVARCRDDDVGDDPALETAHPVGEHDRGHPAERLEALGEEAQGGRLGLVGGEADEAHPAPGEHGAEDVQHRPQRPSR